MSGENLHHTWKKGEVYFLSHGNQGAMTMFDTESSPFKAWIKFGKTVKEAKPRGLIIVSAHWEHPEDRPDVLVNVDTSNQIIYDFYNFPRKYYEQSFISHGDDDMARDVKQALKQAGIKTTDVSRGPDHGVWVPFKVAFGDHTDIPIIQVSLPGDGSPTSAAKLGQGLASLRNLGYSIVGSGQCVHNTRDFIQDKPALYKVSYLNAVKSALTSSDPLFNTLGLFKHPLHRAAHPTSEHLLPLAVAVGATEKIDNLEELFFSYEGLDWGLWMWK